MKFRRLFGILLCIAAVSGAAGCHWHRKQTQLGTPQQQQQVIDALRAAYAAFNRGDIDAAIQPLDPQIEWSEPKEFPNGGLYHGRDGARHYLQQSRDGLAEGSSEPEAFIVAGNRVVVYVHAHVRPKGSTEWLDLRLADVYTIRDGKAVAMQAFADRTQALQWAATAPSR